MNKLRQKMGWIGFPCFLLFTLLYLFPFLITFGYSLLNNAFEMTFVGFDNYATVFQNRYFQLAVKNTLLVTCVLVVVTALFALGLACFLQHRSRNRIGLLLLLLLPMLIPSVSCVALWKNVFHTSAYASTLTCYVALVSLFAWKYTGASAVLLYVGLRDVEPLLLDAAALDGAGAWRTYFHISLPCIRNHVSIMLMLLVMFSLRIYKESYLLFGDYPSNDMYLLAHYMSNHFIKMHYQNVAVSSVSLATICLLLFIIAHLGRGKEARA